MADPSVLLSEFETIVQVIQPFFVKFSILVGGVFGIYFLLLLVRIYFENQKVRLLRQIRFDLDQLNMSQNIPYSKNKKGFWKKLWYKITKK